MFERFTDRARRVVVLAQEEARLLNHGYIGTEHLLLGLLHEGEGVAARALVELGLDLDTVRAEVVGIVGKGDGAPTGHVPFTPRAKKVLELSLREALTLGHNYIGTEHILLGLVREGEGVAPQVMAKKGIDLSRVRQQVIAQMADTGVRTSRTSTAEVRAAPPDLTPAASAVMQAARQRAGGRPVGTHHLLAAMLRDSQSLAAQVLAGCGVDNEEAERRMADLDPTGTSDEMPEEAGGRRTSIRLLGDKVAVLLDDEALRARLASAMGRIGRETLTRTTDPVGNVFPRLWRSVNDALGEVLHRMERPGAEGEAETQATSDWRPPVFEASWQVAAYAVITGPVMQGALGVAEGVDRDAVRAGLAEWLTANQPPADIGQVPVNYLSVTVDAADDAWGRVVDFRWSVDGPGPHRPLSLLVSYAIVELSGPASPAEDAGPPPAGGEPT